MKNVEISHIIEALLLFLSLLHYFFLLFFLFFAGFTRVSFVFCVTFHEGSIVFSQRDPLPFSYFCSTDSDWRQNHTRSSLEWNDQAIWIVELHLQRGIMNFSSLLVVTCFKTLPTNYLVHGVETQSEATFTLCGYTLKPDQIARLRIDEWAISGWTVGNRFGLIDTAFTRSILSSLILSWTFPDMLIKCKLIIR